jgi:hypothetical protein
MENKKCHCNHPEDYCNMRVNSLDFNLNDKKNWFKSPNTTNDPVEFNLDHGNWYNNLNSRADINSFICARFTDDSHIVPTCFRDYNEDLHHTMRNLHKPYNRHCTISAKQPQAKPQKRNNFTFTKSYN